MICVGDLDWILLCVFDKDVDGFFGVVWDFVVYDVCDVFDVVVVGNCYCVSW